jgi:ribonuclease HI
VDAHLCDDGHWGFGLVLRRVDGLCVGAATKLIQGSGNVELAEATGLHEALVMIESPHLQNVEIKMDAERVVRAIHNKSFPRFQWGQMARNCARVMESNGEVSLKWVSRKDNEAVTRWHIGPK